MIIKRIAAATIIITTNTGTGTVTTITVITDVTIITPTFFVDTTFFDWLNCRYNCINNTYNNTNEMLIMYNNRSSAFFIKIMRIIKVFTYDGQQFESGWQLFRHCGDLIVVAFP
ncbi:hypothetical protein GQX74_008130 [Glossina fuscipes]|nr:hypothetical protein GQX74_008130 [Glossina fuscipes]